MLRLNVKKFQPRFFFQSHKCDYIGNRFDKLYYCIIYEICYINICEYECFCPLNNGAWNRTKGFSW